MVFVTTPVVDLATPDRPRTGLDAVLEETWQAACSELGLDLVRQRNSFLRSSATGVIDGHDVTIALVGGTRHERFVRTMYSVRFDAAHAPPFSLSNRTSDDERIVDTGNPYFDRRVAIETETPAALSLFLTAPRRTRILHTLLRWPNVTITNHVAHVCTEGIEDDFDTLVVSAHRLVETATAFGRTSQEVRLDEAGVLRDLFGLGRSMDEVAARFERTYQGRDVSWRGEVLQVGAVDRAGLRVAVLLGSADGRNRSSGRVVALTALDPAAHVTHGDVVNVTGQLMNLDPKKRLFRIE